LSGFPLFSLCSIKKIKKNTHTQEKTTKQNPGKNTIQQINEEKKLQPTT